MIWLAIFAAAIAGGLVVYAVMQRQLDMACEAGLDAEGVAEGWYQAYQALSNQVAADANGNVKRGERGRFVSAKGSASSGRESVGY